MATVTGSLRNKVLVLDDVTTGDLTVTGNISISGSATTLNSTNTSINDSLIELNAGLTGTNPNDLGLILERGSSGSNVFIGWDESADKVVAGLTTSDGTATGNLSLTYANFQAAAASFTGRITSGEHVMAASNVYANGPQGFVFGTSTGEGEYINRSGNDIQMYANGGLALTVASGSLAAAGTISGTIGTFTTSLDASLTVASSDAITGIAFTDPGATGHIHYVGASDKFYTTGKLAVNSDSLGSNMEFQVNGDGAFTGGIYLPNNNSRIYSGSSNRMLEGNTAGTQLTLGESYGIIKLFKTQNAVNELKLYNNRQDAGNVGTAKISGQNGGEVSNITFLRGGGGSTGYLRFATKYNNSASVSDVFQIGDNTQSYGVNVMDGSYRVGGNVAIDANRSFYAGTQDAYNMPSSAYIDWANGDARIREGLVNNYSLSFQTYDGTNLTTALRLDGNNHAAFEGTIQNGSIWINDGTANNSYNENIRLFNAPNGVSVIGFSASGTAGTPTTSILGYSDRLETRVGSTWRTRVYGGYLDVNGTVYASKYYTSGNTTYYVDPANTSNVNNLYVNGTLDSNGAVGDVIDRSFVEIYVYGSSDTTYYPVVISSSGEHYAYQDYSVSRRYNWTAPASWNTSTHQGALTLTWQHSGDTAWGGNDKDWRVIQFDEIYTTVCNGMQLATTGGMVVWLRGGGSTGARYRIQTPRGVSCGVTIYDGTTSGTSGGGSHNSGTTFTAGDGTTFSAESYSANSVTSRIKEYWPVRNKNTLFDTGNRVLDQGSTTQTKSGILQSSASVRAPIFYDTSGTTYYLNLDSTGTSLNIPGIINTASQGTSNNWKTAYDRSITSASVSGTTSKTITLNRQDGGTITASWTDYDSDTDTNNYLSSAAFSNSSGVLTLNRQGLSALTVDMSYRNKGTGVNYVASSTTNNSTTRANFGTGITTYTGYSTGTNRPHTYDSTIQIMPAANAGFELSANWIGQTYTPLKIRSLRDCCQGWSTWSDVATAGHTMSGSFTTTGNWQGAYFIDHNDTSYWTKPGSTSTSVPGGKFKQFVSIGDGTGASTNDGTWGARLNIIDGAHSKIVLGHTATNSIMSHWYAHSGHDSIKFGTGNNHDVEFQRNGTTELELSAGRVQIPTDRLAVGLTDTTDGDMSLNAPQLHVKAATQQGVNALVARFEAGNDNDNTGAAILINHSNDRGLLIEGGREVSDRAVGYFGLVNSGGTHTRMMSLKQLSSSEYFVGIGTDDPTDDLHVHNGSIYVTPVTYAANQNNWGLKLGASNHAGWDHLGIKVIVDSSGSPRMALMSSGSSETISVWAGKVGIGKNNPSYKLHVNGTTLIDGTFGNPNTEGAYRLKFYDNGGTYNDAGIGLDGSAGGSEKMWFNALGGFYWNYGTNAIKMTLDGSGRLGIGTAPSAILHSKSVGATYSSGSIAGIFEDTTARATVRIRSIAAEPAELFFDSGGATRWDFSTRGSSESYRLDLYGQHSTPSYTAVAGPYITVLQSGNVGIGRTAPTNKFHVVGDARIEGNLMAGSSSHTNVPAKPIHIKSSGDAVSLRLEDSTSSNLIYDLNCDFGTGFKIIDQGTAGTSNNTRLLIDTTGHVYTYNNTYLGNNNGDQTHINDTLYLGATDSGDSHFYFGENSSNWYGDHWYWDSSYTVNRYSRYAGTDSLIEKHDTRYTHKVQTARAYERTGVVAGYQIGSYNTSGANEAKTNPIYTIGNSYRPTDTSLSNMYGIGFTTRTSANFLSGFSTSGWGQYVAQSGTARIWLDATAGNVESTGSLRSPIFEDKDNTGYYVSPASSSKMVYLGLATDPETSGSYRLKMGGDIHMNNNSVHYAHQVHFNDGTRFQGNSSSALNLYGNDTSSVELQLGTGAAERHGSLYADASNNVGLLDSDGHWGIRHASNSHTEFRVNNSERAQIDNTGIKLLGAYDQRTVKNAANLGGANLLTAATDIARRYGGGSQREFRTFVDGSQVACHYSQGVSNGSTCYQWISTEFVDVDPEKDYEYTIWVQAEGDHNVYMGWHEKNAAGSTITSNPYMHTSTVDTNGGWVKLTAKLKGHRTPSAQGDAAADRWASAATWVDNGSGVGSNDGVMHAATTQIMMRFGTCYGTANTAKTYFYLPSIREIPYENAQQTFIVPNIQNNIVQAGTASFGRTEWSGYTGIQYRDGAGSQEFRMSSDSGDLNLRVDGTGQFHGAGGVEADVFKDINNAGYFVKPADTSNLNALGVAGNLSIGGTTTSTGHIHTNAGLRVGGGGDPGGSGLRLIGTHGTTNAWIIKDSGTFVFARNHDWTQSFALDLSAGTSGSGTAWATIGQKSSNNTNGTWRGIDVRKYASGNVAGDVKAGNYYLNGSGRYYGDSTTYYMTPQGQSMFISGSTTSLAARNGIRFYHSIGPQMILWYHASGTGVGNLKIASSNTGVGDVFQFENDGDFHAKGDITAYSTTTTSDARLKENVRDLEGSLDKTLKLRGVKFDWIDESKSKDNLGFIAQEVEEVIPEVVKDITNIDGEEHKVVNYQAVVPVLVEAIKELKAEIDELREQLKNK